MSETNQSDNILEILSTLQDEINQQQAWQSEAGGRL